LAIATISPVSGQTLATFAPLSEREIERKLHNAAAAFEQYRRSTFDERSRLMSRAAEALEARREELARLATLEMGKPIQAARDEVSKCAWACRYYADNAARFLSPETVETEGQFSSIRYQPLGAVLAIMPWNFPFWQVFRFAAPALMAGNAALLKHASNVPQCALAIEQIFEQAGFPAGVFQTLLIGSDQVSVVISDPRVAAVTLTGSQTAGAQVASEAGRRVKKTVLELGGSDPFIVMASADLERALDTAVKARVINNGQSCIAAKRFIVSEQIADRFEEQFTRRMAALRVGDPIEESTAVGPLATAGVLKDLEEQVRQSVAAGARILTGGKRLDRAGYFYEPTVLASVPVNTPAYRDEIFGPVATLFRATDLSDAIRIANDTSFGLGASVWTSDSEEQSRFIEEIEAGLVFVNGMVASDPRLPFGGVKQSGYGRELGVYGIREFVNIKTVCISAASPQNQPATE
jgi:succinate-semialdehyde dehydrogenase / glutarate-semialdehyde dehydrogenase